MKKKREEKTKLVSKRKMEEEAHYVGEPMEKVRDSLCEYVKMAKIAWQTHMTKRKCRRDLKKGETVGKKKINSKLTHV